MLMPSPVEIRNQRLGVGKGEVPVELEAVAGARDHWGLVVLSEADFRSWLRSARTRSSGRSRGEVSSRAWLSRSILSFTVSCPSSASVGPGMRPAPVGMFVNGAREVRLLYQAQHILQRNDRQLAGGRPDMGERGIHEGIGLLGLRHGSGDDARGGKNTFQISARSRSRTARSAALVQSAGTATQPPGPVDVASAPTSPPLWAGHGYRVIAADCASHSAGGVKAPSSFALETRARACPAPRAPPSARAGLRALCRDPRL